MKWKTLRFLSTIVVFTCLLSTCFVWSTAQPAVAAQARSLTKVAGRAGTTSTITGWQILSSASTSDSGASISMPTYNASGWLPVSARSTVLSGLIQNGKYPNVFYSTNLASIATSQFQVPWWYRENFTVAAVTGLHTVLHLDGVNYAADVYLNGQQIATRSQIIGANAANDIDITSYVQTGDNAIALEAQPSDPNKDLAIGWVDWNPPVPDGNMGIWQDVTLHQSGPVALTNLRVTSSLASDLGSADVMVKVDAHNNTSSSTTTTVSGSIGSINFSKQITLAANATQTVSFTSSDTSVLHITHPNVWWPAGMGAHPLYSASLQASVNGTLSDSASTTFGIRSLTSGVNSSGYRWYKINGQNVLIRGGGWAPDMFLRSNPARLDQEFKVIVNMGLNAIRQEGKLETPEFYDTADKYGILLLPGWECCDKWQAGSKFTAADSAIAQNSMLSVAERIRNHPSVISFLIGSDEAPPAALAKLYQAALQQAEFPDPVVSEAAQGGVAPYGESGMKMNGPYDWIVAKTIDKYRMSLLAMILL
jgi:exo-1,4-beta-D-glucosaminidase